MPSDRVCVGVITSPHGVRGVVRIKPFTEDPRGITAYGPVSTADGIVRRITIRNLNKGMVLAAIEGIDNRDLAEQLKGQELFVDRSTMPEPEDGSVYRADLLGKKVVDPARGLIGTVLSVHDHGAGAMLEIAREGAGSVLVPFGGGNPVEIEGDTVKLAIDPAWLED